MQRNTSNMYVYSIYKDHKYKREIVIQIKKNEHLQSNYLKNDEQYLYRKTNLNETAIGTFKFYSKTCTLQLTLVKQNLFTYLPSHR